MNSTIQDRAYEQLESSETYPGMESLSEIDRVIQFFHYPAFGNHSTWAVFRSEENLRVRRIEWDRMSGSGIPSPSPTLYASEAFIPKEELECITGEFSRISIKPFAPSNMIGLDGESFRIKSGSHWCGVDLKWWCKAPTEWNGVSELFDQAIKTIEAHLPKTKSREGHNQSLLDNA